MTKEHKPPTHVARGGGPSSTGWGSEAEPQRALASRVGLLVAPPDAMAPMLLLF